MQTPTIFTRILTCLFTVCTLSLSVTAEDQRPAKPNVVLMFVDDLGWQDVKCYDVDEPSPMETLTASPRKVFSFGTATPLPPPVPHPAVHC
jgi:hypothetical protein